jgi:peroxiredoxin
MSPGTRRLALASVAAMVVAMASVVAVLALAGRGRQPEVDGEFVLDQPGVYSEPIVTVPVDGQQLPNLLLVDADGATVPLASFVGRPMVVNVWYSSCPGCAEELQAFAEVSAELSDTVQFLGVDPVDQPQAMVEFASARGIEYPLLRDADGEFVTALGLTGFPTTLFVDLDGTIVAQTGQLSQAALRSQIADLLG